MTAPTITTPEIVDDLTEASTKADIWDHLRQFHRGLPYHFNTKTVKADLLAWHDRVHTLPDDKIGYHINKTHAHYDPAVAGMPGDPFAELTTKVQAGLPAPGSLQGLSAADKAALVKLIDADYANLAEQVEQAASVFRAQRRAAIGEEWAAKNVKLADAQAALNTARAKAVGMMHDVLAKQVAKGYIVERYGRRGSTFDFSMDVPTLAIAGASEAFEKIEREVAERVKHARSLITVHRNQAKRAVILAALSPEAAAAATVAVPSVEAIMAEATAQATASLALPAGDAD